MQLPLSKFTVSPRDLRSHYVGLGRIACQSRLLALFRDQLCFALQLRLRTTSACLYIRNPMFLRLEESATLRSAVLTDSPKGERSGGNAREASMPYEILGTGHCRLHIHSQGGQST